MKPDELSNDEKRLLLSIGDPWSTSKDMLPVLRQDRRRVKFLVDHGLAAHYASAGAGRDWYRRTQAGQAMAREIDKGFT